MADALFKKQGSVDHDVDIILHLPQRVVVVVQVHLHRLPFRLRIQSSSNSQSETGFPYLQCVVILQTLAGRHPQIILT